MGGWLDILGSISCASGKSAPFADRGPVLDAHCHLFSLFSADCLLHEILQILRDMIPGAHPLPPDSRIEETVATRPDLEMRSPWMSRGTSSRS